MTTASTVENTALGAMATTGLMSAVAQNATVISLCMTAFFGLIYASCAIWNARSNSKRNQVSERKVYDDVINTMIKEGQPMELIKILNDKKDKL